MRWLIKNLNNNNNETDTIISTKYQEASLKFRNAWMDYMDGEALVKYEIINMVTILEQAGFNRKQAIQRIIDNHKDLKGFSRASMYRELPEEMKRKHSLTDIKKLKDPFVESEQEQEEEDEDVTYKRSQVSNETYEGINTTSAKVSEELEDFRQKKEQSYRIII